MTFCQPWFKGPFSRIRSQFVVCLFSTQLDKNNTLWFAHFFMWQHIALHYTISAWKFNHDANLHSNSLLFLIIVSEGGPVLPYNEKLMYLDIYESGERRSIRHMSSMHIPSLHERAYMHTMLPRAVEPHLYICECLERRTYNKQNKYKTKLISVVELSHLNLQSRVPVRDGCGNACSFLPNHSNAYEFLYFFSIYLGYTALSNKTTPTSISSVVTAQQHDEVSCGRYVLAQISSPMSATCSKI